MRLSILVALRLFYVKFFFAGGAYYGIAFFFAWPSRSRVFVVKVAEGPTDGPDVESPSTPKCEEATTATSCAC